MMQVGQILQERYQLQRPLGHLTSQPDAARQTWLALDLAPEPLTNQAAATPQPVVIKLLAFHRQLQWEQWQLFEREAQILQRLTHSRVPRCHAQFSLESEAGVSWCGLVQDYIPGTSLQQLLDQGHHFKEAEIRHIATAALAILADLHALSPPILHRDLKPSNLILTADQQLYLVDFGAAQNQAIATGGSFTVVGTYGYTPLEQFGGRAVPASDLYALGATLVHLLTGIDPADLPQRHLQLQWHACAPSGLSPTLMRWIDTLIAPALEQRFASAAQALAAIAKSSELEAGAKTGVTSANPQAAIAPRPDSSQIQIQRSSKRLQIQISAPSQGWAIATRLSAKLVLMMSLLSLPLWLAGLAVLPITPLAAFPGSMLPLAIGTPFLLFFHAFFLVGLGGFSFLKPEVIQVLQLLQGQHSLSLNPHCLAIESRFGRMAYRVQHELTPNLQQVRPVALGRVALQAIDQTHLFGWGLAAAEQEWLVQEMQTWLHSHTLVSSPSETEE